MKAQNLARLMSVIAGTTATLLITSNNVAKAFTVSSFLPTGFTDEIAGITGFEIEDFEDTDLISGLSVEWTSPDFGPVTTLPRVSTASDFSFTVDDAWDGVGFLTNTRQVTTGGLSDITILNFADSPTSVGIGISNFQFVGAELLINGNSFASLTSFVPAPIRGAGIKNIYLRIDAESGETIDSIGIDGISGDFIAFDRVAVGNTQSIPESSNILGLFLVGGVILFTGIKFKKKEDSDTEEDT
ncbi:MAG: hypothetical protein AB4041_12730 [Microcystaceae cyanobacterium]